MTATVGCTLVVVAYHRPASLRRLLDGLRAQETLDGHLVVVNVEADTEISAIASDFGAHEVTVENRGYAAAVNRGGRDVRDAVTVFCGDDLEIDPASLERLVATVASGAADVAAPRIVDGAGNDEDRKSVV